LSVIKFSTLPTFLKTGNGLDVGALLASSRGRLPLNALAGAPCRSSIGVIIIYAVGCLLFKRVCAASNCLLSWTIKMTI
jgi:hypothetical protein